MDDREWGVAVCFATNVAIGMAIGIAAGIKEETIPPELIGMLWVELAIFFALMIFFSTCLAHIYFKIDEKRRKSQNN